jgi:hypothetical protein
VYASAVPTDRIQRQLLTNLSRLRRVNLQLSRWDEWDAADLLPPSLRPAVVPPMLDRPQLKSLQAMLVSEIIDLDSRFGLD